MTAMVDDCRAAYLERRAIGQFVPKVFVIEPTSRCNIACVMCPNGKLVPSSLGDMDLEAATGIAKKIAPSAELVMLYFMGEPLLHPRYADFVRIFRRETHAKIVVSTNATLVDESFLDVLREGAVDVVIGCIDGWTAADYERIRRGAKFTDVVRNVERICDATAGGNTRVIAKMLDFGFDPSTVATFKEHWTKRGATPVVGWVDTWAGQFPNLAKIAGIRAPYSNKERVACADLWFKMVVNWQGKVVLCCHNWNYTIEVGSLVHQTLVDAWQSKKLLYMREEHLARRFSCSSLCERCREWGEIAELDVYTGLNSNDLDLVY